MTFAANSPSPHMQFQIPPIQIMGQQPFAGAAQGIFNPGQGRGGRQQGGHGRGCTGSRGGGCGHRVFAQQIQGGVGGIPLFVNGPPVAFVPPTGAQANAPFRTYAGCVGLTWRMDILRQRALPIGAKPTIRWNSPAKTHNNGLTKDMRRAPKVCTRLSCQHSWGSSDGGGWKLHINVKV
jgi:hypothetical protein